MIQQKRQDLIDAFKVGVTLKHWVLACLKDPYAIILLAFLKKKEQELISKTGLGTITMKFIDLERDSWIGISKLRQLIKLFVECEIIDFTLGVEMGTHAFKLTFKPDNVWFTKGPIKRPEETSIFTEVKAPSILWTDAALAPMGPHDKLVFMCLIQNLNYVNGKAFIVRDEFLEAIMSRSKYINGLSTLMKSNIAEEVTQTVPRIGQGYRTFLIKNPNFWGNKKEENEAQATVKKLQAEVFNFDADKLLKERSEEAKTIRQQISNRYYKESTRNVLNNNENFIEDMDLEILATFYGKGLTDGFDRASETMDKILNKEPITKTELTEAIDDVCNVQPLLKANKAIMVARARKRLKQIAPNLRAEEIDEQLDYYNQHGKFSLDVNYQFPYRPTLMAPIKKQKKKYGKNKTVTPSTTAQTLIVQAKKEREDKANASKEQNKMVDPNVANKQIEQVQKANAEAPKKSFIKPIEEPQKDTAVVTNSPRKKTETGMMTAVKFPFSLVQRIRNEKDLEKMRNFKPTIEDYKEADRQVKANAELAQEFCEEIGRTDIIDKYYFNSNDMAKFHSILNFFRTDAHLRPLDELEFYLDNYDHFDWWAITQDGMPRHKNLM